MNKTPPPPPPKPQSAQPRHLHAVPPVPPKPSVGVVINTGTKINMSPRIVLDVTEITGKSIAILGTNGSGKSGTARRMMEEHIRLGLPFAVADIENEFVTLKEVGEVLLAGPGVDYGDIKIDVVLENSNEFHALGMRCFKESKSVVLILGDLDDDTRKLYLNSFMTGLFESCNDPKNRHYYRMFLEECQEYCPQSGLAKSDPLRQTIIRFGKRGRKRKLSLGLISQRPSNVDKDVLTQCHIFLAHFVTYATDVDVYQNALGIANALEVVKAMTPGDAIYIFGRITMQDRITLPKTKSPWDDSSILDTSKFKVVENVQEIQAEVKREGVNDSGMTVIQTSALVALKAENSTLTEQVQGLVDTQIALEQELKDLRAKKTVKITGNVDIDTLMQKNAELQARLDVAEAEALIIRMLKLSIAQN